MLGWFTVDVHHGHLRVVKLAPYVSYEGVTLNRGNIKWALVPGFPNFKVYIYI